MIEGGLIVAGIVTLLIGGMSFVQQRYNPVVFFFFLTTIGVSVWSIGVAIFLRADDPRTIVAAAMSYYIAAALIALSALLVGYVLRYKRTPSDGMMAVMAVPFLAIAVLLAIRPSLLFSGAVVGESNGIIFVPSMYTVYCVYFAFYYVAALVLLYRAYKRADHRWYAGYGSIFSAYLVGGGIGAWFNLVLPALGDHSFIWVGPVVAIPSIVAVYAVIIRYGFFDIRLALSSMVAYVLSVAALALVYIVGIMAMSRWIFSEPIGDIFNLATIGAILLLVFTFQPIKRFFDRITNSLFYRDRYSREEFYGRVSGVLADSTELQPLLRRSATAIAETLGAKQAFYAIPGESRILSGGTKGHGRMAHADYEWLVGWWENFSDLDTPLIIRNIVSATRDGAEVGRLLRSYGAQIVVPLCQADEVKGFLLIGDRRSGRYSGRDYMVLETIADELTIAVQNAMSLREVRLLNETLQQRIDAATRELRMSNAQLRKLDEAKDEFISMASHQLRTPLTSIKGYIDMMLEGDAGEITPVQKKFLTEAFVSSERMVHLINDFLNVSRLQTGKFMVDKRPTDLVKVVEQELDSLKISASGRQLTFAYKAAKNVPKKLMLDEGKIRQVVMNFADNALYYSKPGTTIKVSLTCEDGDVVLRVKDTGIGVPEAEQARLFSKFFRATNARKQRPDGTGVGLYLAKRVISEHGGGVVFSSVEGKGSTFGFRLPLARLRVRDDANELNN